MTKKCIYCKGALPEEMVFDVCTRCGIQVWGEKMYNAILQNMSNAEKAGDLYQGSVTYSGNGNEKKPAVKNQAIHSITKEAIANRESHEIKFGTDQKTARPASTNTPQLPKNEDSSW